MAQDGNVNSFIRFWHTVDRFAYTNLCESSSIIRNFGNIRSRKCIVRRIQKLIGLSKVTTSKNTNNTFYQKIQGAEGDFETRRSLYLWTTIGSLERSDIFEKSLIWENISDVSLIITVYIILLLLQYIYLFLLLFKGYYITIIIKVYIIYNYIYYRIII